MAALVHERLTLDLDTDVAEWCPAAGALARLLAVGTYQLDKASGRREGRLHLYQLEGPLGPSPCRLSPCGGLPGLPGIFDLRWHPRAAPPRPLLAAALADGSLRLLGVDCSGGGGPEPAAAAVAEVAASPAREGSMAVSLDYSRCGAGAGDALAASYSCGALQLFQVIHVYSFVQPACGLLVSMWASAALPAAALGCGASEATPSFLRS